MNLLIWSKDRGAQLDLLLQSVKQFAPKQFSTFVLYKPEGEYSDGYNLCASYHPNVEFVKEVDFCGQTKEILRSATYNAVSTDDSVLFKPFTLLGEHLEGIDIFSLRLGLNTTVQEPFSGRMQPALTKYEENNGILTWDSRLYHPLTNYGFLLGHDFVVYGPRYTEVVNELKFKRTNELETQLFHLRSKFNPFLRSFKESVALNIPSNNTSGVTLADNSLDFAETNRKFLAGKRFRMDEILAIKVVGCHQCVDLVME